LASDERQRKKQVAEFTGAEEHVVRAAAPPVVVEHESRGRTPMATQMTKSQLIEKIAAATELPKKGVKEVFETLATIGYKELKRTGVFLVPGFAKFVVIKKPATKERQGTNPFTKEPMTFKAKPARKIIRARPVKAAKDAV
jgi:nucleoid DNA-binding protein